MKYKDKISIIIPTYNREHLIKRSIDSILNQTYDNIEVIVVDDCSTDNTEKVIKKIKDDRIKYVKLKKNSGACAARNEGIKVATGEYITFNDSDDEYLPNKVEEQYTNLIKNGSDMDICRLTIHDNDYSAIIPDDDRMKKIKKKQFIEELVKGNYISTPTIFIKSKIVKENLFDKELPRFQDYDLALRIVPKVKISVTDKPLCNCYRQSDSISRSPDKLLKAIGIMIGKKYDISLEQKEKLTLKLIDIYADDVINHYESICYNMNCVIEDQKKEIDRLIKEYNNVSKAYDNIVNSKRWKMIDGTLKKFKK